MGIADRDYMRVRREPVRPWPAPVRVAVGALLIGLTVLLLVLSVRGGRSMDRGRERTANAPQSGRQARPVVVPESGTRVNLNTASREELEALPRVGPQLSKAIVEHRPYERVEDLLRVPGIKERTLAQLRSHVTAP